MSNNGMNVRIRTVTPTMAAKWLDAEVKNRPVRSTLVRKYSRDMRNDNWGFSESAIIVTSSDGIINGRHRLHAIVDTGRSQRFIVVRGADPDMVLHMDQGSKRTAQQAANISGACGRRLSGLDMSLAWFVIHQAKEVRHNGSHNERIAAVKRLDASVGFVTSKVTNTVRGITTTAVLAPVVRAHHIGHDVDRLGEFLEVITTGLQAETGDWAAVILRNWCIADATTVSSMRHGGSDRQLVFNKSQNALGMFLLRQRASKLYASRGHLFPMLKDEEPKDPSSAKRHRKLCELLKR